MNKQRNTYLQKMTAWIITMMMLIFLVVSSFYIAAESEHHCHGEADCPICACIQQCQQILHHMSDGMTLQIAVTLPTLIFLFTVPVTAPDWLCSTPISRKVRLNN
ncbi:MAG: hypothetical protein K5682_10985 [Lachnospiraceae bacterium]|nr:hypothetical protein [Lachnospiraceae bacterium]